MKFFCCGTFEMIFNCIPSCDFVEFNIYFGPKHLKWNEIQEADTLILFLTFGRHA